MLGMLGLVAGESADSATTKVAANNSRGAETMPGGPENPQTAGNALPGSFSQNKPNNGGIALALGGGAAKGWAHIGVLRAFEEEKIPISMIAGTSIGALVGGVYLAGRLDELETFARSLTRANIIRYMDFSITGAGLISGMRLALHMETHLRGIKIEELRSNFIAVCTDIGTGHEIWLHDGPLIEALRASYALPGVFAPVVHGGRHLVDGALVNPVPVSACRIYEPDVVVAIDLNSETFGRGTVIRVSHYDNRQPSLQASLPELATERRSSSWRSFFSATDHRTIGSPGDGEPPPRTLVQPKVQPKSRLGTMGVMMEAFNIIQDRISRARMAGDPPDFTIRPKLNSIGLADFHKADEAIRIGYLEGKKRIAELAEHGQLENA